MTMNAELNRDVFERRESNVRSYCRAFPTVFTAARGATLFDADGREYVDFLAGCSSLNYGHNHPDLRDALVSYLCADGIAHGLDMHTSAKADFLTLFERLVLKPRELDYKVMFPGPTGTNAVEAALKLARKVTGRQSVIAFTNGFHGMTLGALAATGNAPKRASAGTRLDGVMRAPYDGYFGADVDTAAQLDQLLCDAGSGVEPPAAILLETVQGEGGLNAASPQWSRAIEAVARRHGALLIVDDIQAGCGRTGPFFSFETSGIEPDIVTMAKSLSGFGLPLAAVLFNPRLDVWAPGEHNGTFRGNNHAFVTGARALELFWSDNALEQLTKRRSAMLAERLSAIVASSNHAVRIKGAGMMMGIEMSSGAFAGAVCKQCFARGLVIETSGAYDEVVKLLCPLTIEDAQLEQGLTIIADAMLAAEADASRTAA
ncbi:MAG: diaminobutyrate--2-oxoglutarate transaminase [Gammaproteobacteria bacterium]|nr:diaminobutyrate--2-oxoglutarate transaminase [Gammaproteobacteria bacterium]